MAVLDNDDFTSIKESIRNTALWDTFKAWDLDKATWKNTFQAAEDWFTNGFDTTPTSSFKATLEVEAGAMTNPQATAVGKAWIRWRFTQ